MIASSEHTFRMILMAGMLVLLPVGIYHRVRSIATREKLDRRQEGWPILLTLRPLGMMAIASMITYVVDPRLMAWSSIALPDELRWVGVGLGLMAELLVIWTLRTLGKNLTDTVATRREHTLVTGGPYRLVRHPFYCCAAMLVMAGSLMAANWFVLTLGAAALGIMVIRTIKEEENLVARFGEEYLGYMERTGRFWPRGRGCAQGRG